MPCPTDQQLAADALHQAFLVNILVEAEANLHEDGSDSGYDSDSDSSSESSESDSGSSSSSSSLSSDEEPGITTNEVMLEMMAQLYSEHYFNHQEPINKDTNQLYLLLHDSKIKLPKIFRSYLQITPDCFDDLVKTIADDHVFYNNSNNFQMPIDQQLAIALYCFGHYGNAASTMKVALWAGAGYGTVQLIFGNKFIIFMIQCKCMKMNVCNDPKCSIMHSLFIVYLHSESPQ